MGSCYCQKPKTLNTDVDIDGHDLKKSYTQNPKKLLRIKSYKYPEMDKGINNIKKVATLYQIIDSSEFYNESQEKPTDDNTKNINDSLIIEYEINEEEQDLIKQALYKYMLFQDMTDEILY